MHVRKQPASSLRPALVAAVMLLAALPAFGQQFVSTGVYIGDGTNGHAVTGIGFTPDLVIVKSSDNKTAYCRTATMQPGISKSLGNSDAARTDRILSLDADGFTLSGHDEVNAPLVTYTWVAMQASSGLMSLGSYVGDGSAFRYIGGSTFEPDAILVMTEDSKLAVLQTATMPLGMSTALAGGNVYTDRILSTTSGGFYVGSRDEINKSGKIYHFVTWNAASGIVALGHYDGDGSSGRAISVTGLEPSWLIVAGEDQRSVVHRPLALGAGDVTQYFSPTPDGGGLITGLLTDGFTVGGTDAVNAAGSAFDWLAFADPGGLVDLALDATVDDDAPAVGDTVRFTFTLTNNSLLEVSGVVVSTDLEPGLHYESASAGGGTFNPGVGDWTIGTVRGGQSLTLVITATIDAGQEGRQRTANAAVAAADRSDPDPENDTAKVAVDIAMPAVGGVRLTGVRGEPAGTQPGAPPRELLSFLLVNTGVEPDTLRHLRVANLTAGSGTAAEMDAEWTKLEMTVESTAAADIPATTAAAGFVAGLADFSGFAVPLAPGDSLLVTVAGGPSLTVRDGIEMRVGVRESLDIGLSGVIYTSESWPLTTGQRLAVDGFVSAQAVVHQIPYGLLAVGSTDNVVLDVSLPADGYLADTLYGFNLVNDGSAMPGTEIARLKAWADDGDGVFSPTADGFLGQLIYSGDRWQLTGLAVPVPPGGIRIYFTVDVAETAQPARDIRLGLPVLYGPAVEMTSGNDGPVDRPLENSSSLGISASDRVIVTTGAIQPGVIRPGARDVPLLDLALTNTYADDRLLQSLTVANTTAGDPQATQAQIDSTLRQVTLRLDGDNDGSLGDLVSDPSLGTGAFVDGRVTFQGLDLDLPAGTPVRLFVTGNVSLTGAAEGDRISAAVNLGSDILVPNSSIVATLPLDSGAEWRIDGMVLDQLTARPVPVQSLGPGAMRTLALDLTVPPNGYLPDDLIGLSVRNAGTAGPADLAQVQLWQDSGNGFFDAGSLDDQLLGSMSWTAGMWASPVLDRPVGRDGLRLYVSIDVAPDLADSATVRMAVPLNGVLTASGNSGPLDQEYVEPGSVVLSTSPLQSTVVFATEASTIGQTGSIRMVVRNTGPGTVYGVTPQLGAPVGDGAIAVGAVSPPGTDIGVGQEAQFVWPFTSTGAGQVVLTANAAGTGGGGASFASVATPTRTHTIYTPASRLDLFPVTNLPPTVNRGQTGLVPMTLTLVNPGDASVADGVLTRLKLRLSETPGGPGVVPADLLSRIVVSEGTNVYATVDSLPFSGQDVDIVLDPPVVVTGREPVSLGVRLDILLNTTVSSFVISITDATFFSAADAINGAAIPVALADGTFPVRTNQANLVSPAGNLTIDLAGGTDHAASPGQADVPLAEFTLANAGSGPSSSAIIISQLACVLRDTSGAVVTAPLARFGQVTLRSAYQEHFSGTPAVLGDTLMVLEMSTPAIIASGGAMTVTLAADLDAGAAPGTIAVGLGDADHVLAYDANTGTPVPVVSGGGDTGPRLAILNVPQAFTATCTGRLPATVSAGLRDVTAFDLSLTHPGSASAAPVALDSLVFTLLDGNRRPLSPSSMLDRVRVLDGATVLGDVVDPDGPAGRFAIPLGGAVVVPGQTRDLQLFLDLLPGLTDGALELLLATSDVYGHATTTAEPVPCEGTGTWPASSGVARIVVPAEELAVGGEDLMPPLLAGGPDAYPVLGLSLRNTAPATAGDIALTSLTITQPAGGPGTVALGQALSAVSALLDGNVVATNEAIVPGATSTTLVFPSPLTIAAGQRLDFTITVTVSPQAPTGTLALAVADTGIAAGLPGAGLGGIRIVPETGTSLPLVSSLGNLTAADLAASYVNFPNPFAAGREVTTFAFALAADARVTLKLYTPHGEDVATIIDGEQRPAAFYQADTWDGSNGRGETVRNGVYLAEIVAEYADGTRDRLLRKVAVVR